MSIRRAARLILAAALAGLCGCNSNSSNPSAPNPVVTPPGIMSAVVNSFAWSAGGSTHSPAAADYTGGTILIVGYRYYADGSGSYVLLHVEKFTGAKTYTLSTGALSGARAIYATWSAAHDTTKYSTDGGYTGTLTVTTLDELNRNVKGTFSFTGYHPPSTTAAAVTSGSFDVSF